MKELAGYIESFIYAIVCVLCMSSCIYDYDSYSNEATTGETDPDKALFVLHIMPINTRGAQFQSDNDVVEKIKSLRVIAISREGEGKDTIEINRLVNFDNDTFSFESGYAFTWKTTPGKKDFYVIANEESVPTISFEDTADLPNDVKSINTLTDLLSYYKATPSGEEFEFKDDAKQHSEDYTETQAISNVTEFEKAINAVYFAPKYEITDNKQIFLPYSTCYKDVEVKSLKETNGKADNQEMYLVPVATKFYFSFYNYHENEVKIQKLTIEKTDSENFLLGQVAEDEQMKEFNSHPNEPEKNESYYWVDWLKMVADETQNNLSNDNAINEQYGWISNYSMPKKSEKDVQTLIGTDAGDEETIPACTLDMAGELHLGPYYFPESCYMVETDDDGEQKQQYTLGLHLHDTEVDSATSNDFNEKLGIDNVQSLFRDTCVLIKITMRTGGDVEVYAEMADWVHKEVSGWADGGSIIP